MSTPYNLRRTEYFIPTHLRSSAGIDFVFSQLLTLPHLPKTQQLLHNLKTWKIGCHIFHSPISQTQHRNSQDEHPNRQRPYCDRASSQSIPFVLEVARRDSQYNLPLPPPEHGLFVPARKDKRRLTQEENPSRQPDPADSANLPPNLRRGDARPLGLQHLAAFGQARILPTSTLFVAEVRKSSGDGGLGAWAAVHSQTPSLHLLGRSNRGHNRDKRRDQNKISVRLGDT